MENETELGKKIASLRDAKGLSARALSRELRYSDNYISHIERGIVSPSQNVLNAICNYFNIEMVDLYDKKNKYPIQYAELIEELNKLDSQELQKVVDFVKLITIHKK